MLFSLPCSNVQKEEDRNAWFIPSWENCWHRHLCTFELVHCSCVADLVSCQRVVCPVVSWLVHPYLLDHRFHLSPAVVCLRSLARTGSLARRTSARAHGKKYHPVYLRWCCHYRGGDEAPGDRVSNRSHGSNHKLVPRCHRIPTRMALSRYQLSHRGSARLPCGVELLVGCLQSHPRPST